MVKTTVSSQTAQETQPQDAAKSRLMKKNPLDLRKYAQQIWLAGLGAFVRAEEEGNKLFDALVKVGEELEAKSVELADQTVGRVSDKAKESVESVLDTKERLERLIEQVLQQSLHKMGLVTQQDLQQMIEILAQMDQKMACLIEENQQLRQQLCKQ